MLSFPSCGRSPKWSARLDEKALNRFFPVQGFYGVRAEGPIILASKAERAKGLVYNISGQPLAYECKMVGVGPGPHFLAAGIIGLYAPVICLARIVLFEEEGRARSIAGEYRLSKLRIGCYFQAVLRCPGVVPVEHNGGCHGSPVVRSENHRPIKKCTVNKPCGLGKDREGNI